MGGVNIFVFLVSGLSHIKDDNFVNIFAERNCDWLSFRSEN